MKMIKISIYILLMIIGIYCIASAQTINDLEYQKFQEDENGNVCVTVVIGAGDLGISGTLSAGSFIITGTGDATLSSGTEYARIADNLTVDGMLALGNNASGTGVNKVMCYNPTTKLVGYYPVSPLGGSGDTVWNGTSSTIVAQDTGDSLQIGTTNPITLAASTGNISAAGLVTATGGVTASDNIQLTANNLTMTGFSSFNQQGATFKFYSDSNKIVELTKTGNSGIEATIYGDLSTSGVNYVQKDLTLKGNLFISSALTATGAGTGPTTYIRTKIGNTWYKLTAVRE